MDFLLSWGGFVIKEELSTAVVIDKQFFVI